jgi:hypothetical protein
MLRPNMDMRRSAVTSERFPQCGIGNFESNHRLTPWSSAATL